MKVNTLHIINRIAHFNYMLSALHPNEYLNTVFWESVHDNKELVALCLQAGKMGGLGLKYLLSKLTSDQEKRLQKWVLENPA